jgi:tetratricopeptide (TPR) repeat protein
MSEWSKDLNDEQSTALALRLQETGTLDERRMVLRQLENAIGEMQLLMITKPEEAGLLCRQLLEQLYASDALSSADLNTKWQRRRDALEMSLTNYLAQSLVEAGDWENAAATYERCLDLGMLFQVPEFQADSFLKLGKAYRHAGKLLDARLSFERAATLSQLYGLFSLEAESLYQQAVVDELEARVEDAVRHYRAGLRLSQSQRLPLYNVRFLSQLGQLHHSLGAYGQALDYYRHCLQALRAGDTDLESEVIILGQISHVCAELRDFQAGVTAAEEGLNLSRQIGQQAEEEVFLNDLARLYGWQGHYEHALVYASEARHLASVRGNLASLKLVDQLIARIKQQQALEPDDQDDLGQVMTVSDPKVQEVTQYYQRGNRYYHRGAFDRAINAYSRAVNLDPTYLMAYIKRGSAYTAKGHYDRALADYARAIELDHDNPLIYFNRGNAYRKRREYEKALEDYNHAIQLEPRDPDVYFNRGEVLRRLGRRSEAVAALQMVIELSAGRDQAGVEQARRLLEELA